MASSRPNGASGDQPRERYRRVWRLHGMGGRADIIHRRDLLDEDRYRFDPPEIPTSIEGWLTDAMALQAIAEMYEAVTGQVASALSDTNLEVRPRLEQAFRSGELLLLLVERSAYAQTGSSEKSGGAGSHSTPGKGAPPPPSGTREKTWIEFEVLWADGTPAAGVGYRLKITDGSERTGGLDAQGRVRVSNIDPGSCDFSLIDIDGSCWTQA